MDQYILYPIVALGTLIVISEIPSISFYIKGRKLKKELHEAFERNERASNNLIKTLEDEDIKIIIKKS